MALNGTAMARKKEKKSYSLLVNRTGRAVINIYTNSPSRFCHVLGFCSFTIFPIQKVDISLIIKGTVNNATTPSATRKKFKRPPINELYIFEPKNW